MLLKVEDMLDMLIMVVVYQMVVVYMNEGEESVFLGVVSVFSICLEI